jgi:hypothetical protein
MGELFADDKPLLAETRGLRLSALSHLFHGLVEPELKVFSRRPSTRDV